jgi:tripartite-type tricarboxylate transporter receptor subunit TctC
VAGKPDNQWRIHVFSKKHKRCAALILTGAAVLGTAGPSFAAWQPTKPVEFVATAGPGGGTDIIARTIQTIIVKHKLLAQPVTVVNKPGGSGLEGYLYGKQFAGDPHKLVVGTSNTWAQPMVRKLAYKHTDFTPVAALVQDEFMLWVKQDAPYRTVRDYLKAAGSKEGNLKMGGALSLDADELLTRIIEKTAKVKFAFIPFRSGAVAATELAAGKIDSHVNNPSESVAEWRSGTQRPICVFRTSRLPTGSNVTATQGWRDIPTCVESGLDIPLFQQPRTVWLPLGVTAEQVAFYVALMKKVQAAPEWKEYIDQTSQTSVLLTGPSFDKFVAEDIARIRKIATEQGWQLEN